MHLPLPSARLLRIFVLFHPHAQLSFDDGLLPALFSLNIDQWPLVHDVRVGSALPRVQWHRASPF